MPYSKRHSKSLLVLEWRLGGFHSVEAFSGASDRLRFAISASNLRKLPCQPTQRDTFKCCLQCECNLNSFNSSVRIT